MNRKPVNLELFSPTFRDDSLGPIDSTFPRHVETPPTPTWKLRQRRQQPLCVLGARGKAADRRQGGGTKQARLVKMLGQGNVEILGLIVSVSPQK